MNWWQTLLAAAFAVGGIAFGMWAQRRNPRRPRPDRGPNPYRLREVYRDRDGREWTVIDPAHVQSEEAVVPIVYAEQTYGPLRRARAGGGS